MFLSDLLHRTLGETGGIVPRRASRFEPENDAAEPTAAEALAAAPSRREAVLSAPPLERHTETIVHELVEPGRQAPPAAAAAPAAPAPLVVENSIAPAGADRAGAAPEPPESAQPRREPPAPRTAPPPSPVSQPGLAPEFRTETIIREALETRLEDRIIERRLESLVREVNRTHEVRSETIREVPGAPTSAAPAPTAGPRTPVIVPVETRRSEPAQPMLLETPAAAQAEPVVHVTIGRVEIRAASPGGAHPKPRPQEPRLSLDDYLRKRERA